MRCRRGITVMLFGLALSAPVFANERDPFAQMDGLLDPQVLLRGLVTESDVSLLFAYLRSSLLAGATGNPPDASPEIARRAEQLGNELKLRGGLVALALLSALEESAKQALRDMLRSARTMPSAPLQ